MYEVIVGEESKKTDLLRMEAVRAAKELGGNTHRPVRVENERQFDFLTFRRGKLIESRYVTRDRRRRSRAASRPS